MQQEIDPRIKQAERVRENGKTQQALKMLGVLAEEFANSESWLNLAAVLGHIIVCFKHFAQNFPADREHWLTRMTETIARGMALPIPDANRRAFVLRAGDVALMRDNWPEALRLYREAVRLAEGTPDEWEYKGHLAVVMAQAGELYAAATMIREAIVMFYRTRYAGMEYWRWWVILSGLFARQVEVERACGRTADAAIAFAKGYLAAWWLLVRYWKPQRWRQYHQAIRDELLKLIHRA